MKRIKFISILALLLMTVTQGAWAQETLTVFDGTGGNSNIPMCGYYFDYYTKSECIIPASELTAMEGGTITAITFYVKEIASSQSGNWNSTNQKVFLKEVSGTTLSSYSGMADATVVFDGSLPIPTTLGGYTITFSQGYTYNGGNLLIGVYNEKKGAYNKVTWYGNNNQSSGVSAFGYNNDNLANAGKSNQTFLPKTTFTYTPAPTAVDLGLPSGKRWADMNVGAGSETGYGTYYAWSSSDIATAQWGVNWRMPTLTEVQELINNTDHVWATIGGVNGMKYMKKTDHSVYIFLPAAGWNANTNVGTKGTYWTSTTLEADANKAYELYHDETKTTTGNDSKTYRFSIRPVQMFVGEGTEASPYLIASTTDWNNLVSAVNAGETYSGNYFKMTANVGTVSTWMTGTFSGTFDGDGKTLTVGYSTSARYCAPFGTLGGTVKNLRVDGTVSTSGKNFGGIAAQVTSGKTATIQNCRVSTSFTSTLSGDNSSSSFVGVVWSGGTLNITGCAFTGSLTGSGNAFGGFLGYKEGTCSMTDCLFAPASVTVSTEFAGTFSRPSAPTITNCYFTRTFGGAQGLQARTIAKGDYVSTLSVTKGSATATYAVSGITVYSGGIDFNDGSTTTFYGGSGQTVSLALTAETRSGYQFKQYAASQGSLSGQTTNAPTLTMPAANSTANDVVTISAEYDPTYNATFAQNIDDAEHWTISPTKTTAGTTVSLAYTGTTHRVNSVTVMKEGEATETFETTKVVNNYTGTNVSIYAEHEGDENGFNVHSDFATTISTTNGKNITSVVLTTGYGYVTPSNLYYS